MSFRSKRVSGRHRLSSRRSSAVRSSMPGSMDCSQTSLASSVISAFRTLETGQFFSAAVAMAAKAASSIPGTVARRVRAERLMRKPWPSGSRVTAASVVGTLLVLEAGLKGIGGFGEHAGVGGNVAVAGAARAAPNSFCLAYHGSLLSNLSSAPASPCCDAVRNRNRSRGRSPAR